MYLSSQCMSGDLQPELYRAGTAAINMGVEAGPRMTPEVSLMVPFITCVRPLCMCGRLTMTAEGI